MRILLVLMLSLGSSTAMAAMKLLDDNGGIPGPAPFSYSACEVALTEKASTSFAKNFSPKFKMHVSSKTTSPSEKAWATINMSTIDPHTEHEWAAGFSDEASTRIFRIIWRPLGTVVYQKAVPSQAFIEKFSDKEIQNWTGAHRYVVLDTIGETRVSLGYIKNEGYSLFLDVPCDQLSTYLNGPADKVDHHPVLEVGSVTYCRIPLLYLDKGEPEPKPDPNPRGGIKPIF